jgi:UMF1 family MFS transporter
MFFTRSTRFIAFPWLGPARSVGQDVADVQAVGTFVTTAIIEPSGAGAIAYHRLGRKDRVLTDRGLSFSISTRLPMAGLIGSALNPGVHPRELSAWASYDFANSGYTTVVVTAVFSAYFVGVVAGDADWATLAWTSTLAASNTAVLIAMPIIGAYADLHACKRFLLLLSTVGCVMGTAALALVGPGDIALAVPTIIFSNFCFMVGFTLIAAFLPEIARPHALGRVSGWGWSFGYLGGLAALGACLAYVASVRAQGSGPEQFVPVTMLITAGIFALAAPPALIVLKERAVPRARTGTDSVRMSIGRLAATLGNIGRYRDFARLLACSAFYQAGVAVVIALAAIYAQQVMKFSYEDTLLLVLVVNLTAAIGAFSFGYVQDRLGHKRALALTLVVWIAMTVLASIATTRALFWLAANLAGLAVGSSQSAGRAMTGVFAPRTRLAEFFGLWTVSVQVAAIVGPLAYGAVVHVTSGNHRLGLMMTGGFFVIGLAVLASIDIERGRRAASDEDAASRQALS